MGDRVRLSLDYGVTAIAECNGVGTVRVSFPSAYPWMPQGMTIGFRDERSMVNRNTAKWNPTEYDITECATTERGVISEKTLTEELNEQLHQWRADWERYGLDWDAE